MKKVIMCINQLQCRIFQMIDYYKVTSLVCRRWNSVTFGTNKVQLNVTVLNRDRSSEKSYLRLLSKSKRRYKNLKLADCQRSLVLKLLPKFSSNLNSLTLSCNFELRHLAKIFQHCSNLRTLDIKFSNFDRTSKKSNILPSLPNLQTLKVDITFLHLPKVNLHQHVPNLTSLTLLFSEDLPVPQPILDFISPRLRELDLQVNFPHEPASHFHQIWHAKFPLLTHFTCYLERIDKPSQPYDPASKLERFLDQSWTHLESAKLYRVLYNRWQYLDFLPASEEGPLFSQLSRTCSTLRELSLGMLKLQEEQFVQLCELPHLRVLHIEESTVHTPGLDSCRKVESLVELSLQSTEIDDTTAFNEFIGRTFPNLARLSAHNCKNLFEVAELSFSRLEALEHLSVRQILPLSWDYLANLSTFPVLRTVTIFCDRFADNSPDQRLAGVVSGSIRTLTVTAELNDEILRRLVEFFPNLTTLKLRRIGRCTPKGILETRKLVPNCCFELPRN
ncbi:uncharacterized protein LOC119768767 isoform X2 [Culex quinquefasciatus]|uniref:uncharacterized protein LOC119768767 isoform X2 n=1 Tax=Culex quinquefasciatus TaxID=7176 RepID=UPI0018E359BD|nr:uncharacterized protein LOC119768767 isoform X2 [Culex quinquefasciatus]